MDGMGDHQYEGIIDEQVHVEMRTDTPHGHVPTYILARQQLPAHLPTFMHVDVQTCAAWQVITTARFGATMPKFRSLGPGYGAPKREETFLDFWKLAYRATVHNISGKPKTCMDPLFPKQCANTTGSHV